VSFLVEDLISSGKLRSFAPVAAAAYSPADLLTIANEELLLNLVTNIHSVREDYFNTSKVVPVEANVDRYPIPTRSIANTLDAVIPLDTTRARGKPLERIEKSEAYRFSKEGQFPQAFYLEGDEIVVVPKPTANYGFLELSYCAKPNRLIDTSACAKITGITENAGTVVFDVDTDLTGSMQIGTEVDFLSAKNPYLLWADTVEITAITANQISVATSDVVDQASSVEPKVGDYICPTGFANIPMVAEEFHPVLAQMIACRLIAGLGDLNKQKAAEMDLAKLEAKALKLIKNRVAMSPQKISWRNNHVRIFSGRY
jgi:hypothetical protein